MSEEDWKAKIYTTAEKNFFGPGGLSSKKVMETLSTALGEDKPMEVQAEAAVMLMFIKAAIAIERLENHNKKLAAHNDKVEREIDELRKVSDMNNEKAQEQIKELRTQCNKLSTWYADLENKCRTL